MSLAIFFFLFNLDSNIIDDHKKKYIKILIPMEIHAYCL